MMTKGTKIIYQGNATDAQVKWGDGDDPRIHLIFNRVYTIEKIKIHSWYTEVHLLEMPGMKFNMIYFKEI